jgi:hypothetical protein
MLLTHHVNTHEVVMYLGMIVELEMRDGTIITGRVVAADHEKVHLSRTQHATLDLHEIKRVVTSKFV